MFRILRGLAAWRKWSAKSVNTTSRRNACSPRPGTVRLALEVLEDRLTPSFANVSAYEQLMIELVNRARANPLAEAARYGIDLNSGLAAGTIGTDARVPLAPQQALINSAGLYSDDMYARNFFAHVNPEGLHSWDRAINQGYGTTYVGENIAWGTYSTLVNTQEQAALERHRSFMLSPTHRANLMLATYNEIGTGVTFAQAPYQTVSSPGLGVVIATEDFGRRSVTYLTGVAYTDAVARDNFYTIGEGLGGITITATNQYGQIFTTTTAAAGGYALPVVAGTYTVRASGGGLAQPITITGVVVGAYNVKLDFVPAGAGGNVAPRLLPLPDQTIDRGRTLYLALNASDANGDRITYSASVSAHSRAYDLDQELRLVRQNNSYYQNWLGHDEKWVFSQANCQWYFVTPDGRFFRYTSGTFEQSLHVATLDVAVHANPALLHDAPPPQGTPSLSVNINGNLLNVTAPASFGGSAKVTVTVSDGKAASSQSFVVSVRNQAPQLASIADQSMTSSQDTLSLTLNGSDGDGDALTYSASVSGHSLEYELDQQLQLVQQGGTYYENWLQQGEKWLWSQSRNQWYFVTPDGRFFQWTGGTLPQSTLAATVRPMCCITPAMLHDAQPPSTPAVTASVSGNRLTLDPATGFRNSFRVTVTARDAQAAAIKSFVVTFANQAPQLNAIADQTMSRTQGVLQLNLSASDPDGDRVTFRAAVQPYSPLYELNQQLQFQKLNDSYYENWLGAGDKWLRSASDGQWYFLLSNGRLYRWSGAGVATSTLIATFDASVYTEPSLLYQAQPPSPPSATASVSGNLLTIDPASGYTGTFRVLITATDGSASSTRSFAVWVS